MNPNSDSLHVTCPAFGEDGEIPKRHTGFGEDISPELVIDGLMPEVKFLAIVMDDLDIPFIGCWNHWTVWNLPAASRMTEGMPHGAECPNGARQGVGYGKNRYRGPKQPPFIKKAHRYRFTVYGLDDKLTLAASAKKTDLLRAMEGHILQSGELIGWYQP